MSSPYRVIVAKPGLDGHDRGAKVVARALRDAGFEVIYTGLHQSPTAVAGTALQEDADAVGLSILSGAHKRLFPAVRSALDEQGLEDVLLFGGGIIPEEDVPALEAAGAAAVFGPGTSTADIAAWLKEALDKRGDRGDL
ncbi:MAG: cobalamin B12-binding domain-containing protein [Myxococcota bacterium]|nr:cobalamin B12-binding domain-containing protein [Myxococcota bacterium]